MSKIGRNYQRDARHELDQTIVAFHPRLALTFQDRDAFHVGMGV